MTAEIINITHEPQRAISEASRVLNDGFPVAIPTETVYGLAADATRADAISHIYETKGRPQFNPLICHVCDIEMAERYAVFDPASRKLAETFWPGPLTIVLPLRKDSTIHPLATAGLETVGLRCPEGFANDLIRDFGRPLAAPSANTSGKISPTSARHVMDDLGDKLQLIIDGGSSPVGVESTIIRVDPETGAILLLRPGGLAAMHIADAAGRDLERRSGPAAIIEAPGMLASHYAPGASVRLDATAIEPGEALIRFGGQPVAGAEKAAIDLDLSPSADLAQAAANLFEYLKRADASGASSIAVAPIPNEGLGEAINDRLGRAAAPRDGEE
ncbi:L-threonylcarbamoyladenylate synthase [Aliirhizobium cellulosilyticum]|uniref:Threonylcarbamoyl-AMP synthase n=1 Tax=Aliirhizobium cellulosilyticum TaxID=393664 RepID=A0A7W6S757_9HYPH|nr:L-threonylcarbamoyladenylate synthase [Rhizobium cellulosilyticum]MBB4348472.1 L-threonylcarbamoyladenylate synthase [Rhizobium cellulosilyticum]MBB4411708.1 L-threonylcarbamoyladenylate synthase [Rhizobium cellulosilyticum]MBB4446399.1 L-threonylcarbamoyladenylate synthase [Rhizobium cellulosilyticum]